MWQQRQEQGRRRKKDSFQTGTVEFKFNIGEDSSETHPEKICPPCKRLLYRVRESGNAAEVSVSRTIEKWASHMELTQCLDLDLML